MRTRFTHAGGSLLALLILAGFGIGIAVGAPALGAIAGTVAGVLAAVAVWLLDRRS